MAALLQRTITVKLQKDEISVKPFTQAMRPAGEEVVWKATGGDITVNFNKGDGSPFAWTTRGPDNLIASGAPTLLDERTYNYQVTIHRPNQPDVTIDPQVDIDSDTPPPARGGRGKGGRGKGRGKKKVARRKMTRVRRKPPRGPKKGSRKKK